MTDKNDGVLAWFDERIAEFVDAREGSVFWYRRRNAIKARAKVAELLAADEEYDDAKSVFFRDFGAKPSSDRLSAATSRRAAAIRAMRGDV